MLRDRFPIYIQHDEKDCGPTCIRIVSKYYKKEYSINYLRELSETTRIGTSLYSIGNAAEKIGFSTVGVQASFKQLLDEVTLPCIVHWDKKHFVVVYKIKNGIVHVADPAFGKLKYNEDEFINRWIGNNANSELEEGILLLLEPTQKFYIKKEGLVDKKRSNLNLITAYFSFYKKYVLELFLGVIVASLLQLILPFLTKNLVDVGIANSNINFVYLILFAQLMVFIGKTTIEIIQSWLLLHLSTRINISLISDFFIKLMNLPIAYFDSRVSGDIFQRINDHKRIETFLTSSTINVFFAFFNIIIFSIVLFVYNKTILLIFLAGSILYFLWIIFFLKKRKEIDYKNFSKFSEENTKVIEIINGMQEIKLHNAETKKRWSWEYLQARIYKLSMDVLKLDQWQIHGSSLINELKNIIITILIAKFVIDGKMTLGMMLSVSYIVGQLNYPLNNMVAFIHQFQDAKISLERLDEIHNIKDETQLKKNYSPIPPKNDITIKNLSFRYKGAKDSLFEGINLTIPRNKTTAIVGASGSGKTTLMKLLLKFYEPNNGSISIGNVNLSNILHFDWREAVGVVMQDGFIFDASVAENIAVNSEHIDIDRLELSLKAANIFDFIMSLPLNLNTKLGNIGVNISGGQRQRILIARAIYKNPDFIFFDEATSLLDSNNEKEITNNLNAFFENKTAIIIAHRLSTVKDADKIVVLDDGKVIETGNHLSLLKKKGYYYKLVKNQLNLD